MANAGEILKEIAYGASFGILTGYLTQKVGTKVVAGKFFRGLSGALPWIAKDKHQ